MREAFQKPMKLLSPDRGSEPGNQVASSPQGDRLKSPTPGQEHAKRFCVSPSFLLREIAGESVLVPVGEAASAANCIIGLNETGSFLWKQYQTPRTPEEVVRAAQEVYSDSTGKMEQEIHEYTARFLQVGFLREVE